jgi:hypothetical protein
MARARRSRDQGPRTQQRELPEAPPSPRHPPRAWAAVALALVLAWALVFFPQLFLGQRFAQGDAALFRPFAEFSRARWHEAHERTYWNPYVLLGFESVGSFADSRPQYLPDPLLDLAERLHEPAASPQLWMLLALLAGTLATATLASALWRLDPWSALAAGLVWLLASPLLFPWTLGFDAQVVTNALLPVAVLASWAIVAGDGVGIVFAGALALSLTLGVEALHGHPQALVYTADLLVAFALHQAWSRRRWWRLLPWGGSVTLGAAIGTASWWPALLYSGLSSRGSGAASGVALEVIARYSLGWRDLLSFLWPQAVGFGGTTYWGGFHVVAYAPYLGAVAVLLALLGLRREPGWSAAQPFFWWATLVVALALTLGVRLGPVFQLLHHSMPFWSRFRSPSYVLFVAILALALLAARGFARATAVRAGAPSRPSRAGLIACGVAALLGLAIAFPLAGAYAALAVSLREGFDPAAARLAARWAGLGLLLQAAFVALALALLPAARAARRWARPALLALVALDLAWVGLPGLHRATAPAHAVQPPPPPALARVAGPAHARVYAGAARPVVDPRYVGLNYAEAYTNFWVSWRTRCLTGNLGAFPAAWGPVMANQLTRYQTALRAWGVGWLDLDRGTPAPGLTRVAGDAHEDVYALPGALGRAYAVPLVIAVPDADAAAEAMTSPRFDPAQVAVTWDGSVAGPYPGSPACSIHWLRDDPQRLELEVTATDRAFLVVADSHYPGWSAWVDGSPTQISPTNLLVRGLPVPAGRHRVEMRYESPGTSVAVPVTRAALAAWALLAVAGAAWAALEARRARRLHQPGVPTTPETEIQGGRTR